MKYVSPIAEITEIATEDVVMISGLQVQDTGSLTETSWESLNN